MTGIIIMMSWFGSKAIAIIIYSCVYTRMKKENNTQINTHHMYMYTLTQRGLMIMKINFKIVL